ncbi:hypothetical protein SAMN06297144_3447 [Sphingomonas guangdongensis]|uniref:Uncharacterized protein n=1 Tax=Sphingomonas guangdongensis TaxID=1141890 RepID=A0A285R2F8_9SPHN|nr:hypothetical protein [Sphingomonas guangdongensis]SOB88296.1 hypothetical protein SAMN06297144_3447 [Sphingomonas guangdongensis]
MSRNVTVRAVRPHDTADGLRQPGDEYERPEAEAKALAAQGVVTITKATRKPQE